MKGTGGCLQLHRPTTSSSSNTLTERGTTHPFSLRLVLSLSFSPSQFCLPLCPSSLLVSHLCCLSLASPRFFFPLLSAPFSARPPSPSGLTQTVVRTPGPKPQSQSHPRCSAHSTSVQTHIPSASPTRLYIAYLTVPTYHLYEGTSTKSFYLCHPDHGTTTRLHNTRTSLTDSASPRRQASHLSISSPQTHRRTF